MNTEKITRLLTIGQLSIDYWLAVENVSHLKCGYYMKIKEYEEEVGAIEGRLSKYAEDQQPVRDFTAVEYKEYLDAKRIANNLKRRLKHACITTHIDEHNGKFK